MSGDGGSTKRCSRIPGFHERGVAERRAILEDAVGLPPAASAHFASGGGLSVEDADRMSENVVATFGLPLGLGLNFRVNGRDYVVPMATEEPSVVAAASNAARIVRAGGGFEADADPSNMTAQIEIDEVLSPDDAERAILGAAGELGALANAAVPGIAARGGGFRGVSARSLGHGIVVVHVHVDVKDAMGANLVDTVAEALGDRVAELAQGRLGLRILTNLPLQRRVRVRGFAPEAELGGAELADAIVRASRFAELDPFRAVTHNKGFMNGLCAAALALGQDTRALEAGAHGFAALGAGAAAGIHGAGYAPLAVFRRVPGGVEGRAELPLAVGTVGGSCRAHSGVRASFAVLGVTGAGELAMVVASVGLASNLAALRALAGEGIQKGHMRLHSRKAAASSGEVEASAHHEDVR